MTATDTPSVLILGGGSGVGRWIADHFARQAYRVLLAGRNVEELRVIAEDIQVRRGALCLPVYFDALDMDSHLAFVGQCEEILGALPEGVVLCFGFMADQPAAQQDFSLARRTLDTNLTGAISVLERFAERFEQRKSGFIAALSSVAGDRGRKANYIYGASKAGLNAYLQGLRNRLCPAGVRVTTIKPGFMDTRMTYGMKLPRPLVADPEKAAAAMVKAILRGSDVAYVPFYWRYILWIIRAIPEWQFKKMNV